MRSRRDGWRSPRNPVLDAQQRPEITKMWIVRAKFCVPTVDGASSKLSLYRREKLSTLPFTGGPQEIQTPCRAHEGRHQRHGQPPSRQCLQPHVLHRYLLPGPEQHPGGPPIPLTVLTAPWDFPN
ncbi:hypothetical protein MTO96_021959 [Rhipicephalus appendiculatus]